MITFTKLFFFCHLISIVLRAEDLCQKSPTSEGLFWSTGQAPLLGLTRANFKPEFILILVKSLHPSRAFLSGLAFLLLTMR